MNPHDTTLVPSLQDLHAPATGCHGGFREELPCQDADSHPAEPEYTPEEEAEMAEQFRARLLATVPAHWPQFDAPRDYAAEVAADGARIRREIDLKLAGFRLGVAEAARR